MMPRLRRMRRSQDEGATLILALVIVTSIAAVVSVILNQAGASERTTNTLRNQAGSAYNGDAAAQVAINSLRKGTFNNASGATCFPGGSTLLFPSTFYPSVSGAFGGSGSSARVECVGEAGTGAQGSPVPISDANKPGNAILTLSQTEVGQLYGQSNKPVTIHGGVASNSSIDSTSAQLNVTGGVQVLARTGCTGSITPACTPFSTPIADPNYPPPATVPAAPGPLPACNNKFKIAEFSPGLYTNADTFNNCKASWLYFAPGTYFFDFAGAGTHVWRIGGTSSNDVVVAGTLTGAKTDTAPAVPNACVNPINSTSAVGVQFVFGGDSQMEIANGANAEFCASYSSTSIPTVFYGLQASAGTLGSGANLVHTQSGCVIAVSGGCDVISTRSTGSQPQFFFEGFVYEPVGRLNLSVTNATQPYFNFGIISRTLTFNETGSACATCAYISLPDNSLGFGLASTVVSLTVYVCEGQASCASGGKKTLIARVKVDDPSGTVDAGHRGITILGWSEQR